jgi:hypothetical protein
MTNNRDKLERLIGGALREQPLRRAPSSLESRVLAAIESHAVASPWKRGFVHWPLLARAAFILASFGIVKFASLAAGWTASAVDASSLVADASSRVSWIKVVASVIFDSLHSLPDSFLWGGFSIVATLYAAFFTLSAIAYRALFATR